MTIDQVEAYLYPDGENGDLITLPTDRDVERYFASMA